MEGEGKKDRRKEEGELFSGTGVDENQALLARSLQSSVGDGEGTERETWVQSCSQGRVVSENAKEKLSGG